MRLKPMSYDKLKEFIVKFCEERLRDKTALTLQDRMLKNGTVFQTRLTYKQTILYFKEYILNDELDIVVAKENAYYEIMSNLLYHGADGWLNQTKNLKNES
jgi:hypothetical protein